MDVLYKNIKKKLATVQMDLQAKNESQNKPLAKGSKVVLGFSGGLDTSYCVKYLREEKGYEVHSIIVNTGGFNEDELKKKYII